MRVFGHDGELQPAFYCIKLFIILAMYQWLIRGEEEEEEVARSYSQGLVDDDVLGLAAQR